MLFQENHFMGTVSSFTIAIVITLLAMLTINAHAESFFSSNINQRESPAKVAYSR
jgi:hypothetical protein